MPGDPGRDRRSDRRGRAGLRRAAEHHLEDVILRTRVLWAPAAGAVGIGLSYGAGIDSEAEAPADLPRGLVGRLTRFGRVPLRVLVVPTRTGASHLSLCAGTTTIAKMPPLLRGSRLIDASADDHTVIWRTARSPTNGTILEGRISGDRVQVTRQTPTAATGRLERRDGRPPSHPNGDAAWALVDTRARKRTTRLRVWPHRRHVTPITLPAEDRDFFETVQFTDDQHIDVIGDKQPLVAFTPPTPGRCTDPDSQSRSPPARVTAVRRSRGHQQAHTRLMRLIATAIVICLSVAFAGCGGSAPQIVVVTRPTSPQLYPLRGGPQAPNSNRFDARRLLGERIEDAARDAEAHGCTVREVEVDGKGLPITADLVLRRIDVATDHGIVIRIEH